VAQGAALFDSPRGDAGALIVFRHCEGKDSTETIRCTYQAKLNQH